jgi:hypothetical protein
VAPKPPVPSRTLSTIKENLSSSGIGVAFAKQLAFRGEPDAVLKAGIVPLFDKTGHAFGKPDSFQQRKYQPTDHSGVAVDIDNQEMLRRAYGRNSPR